MDLAATLKKIALKDVAIAARRGTVIVCGTKVGNVEIRRCGAGLYSLSEMTFGGVLVHDIKGKVADVLATLYVVEFA